MKMHIKILSTLALAFAACGGGQHPKSGLSKDTGDVPPPPDVHAKKDGDKKTPPPPVSADAMKDYAAAAEFFDQNEKSGWKEDACRASAEKFEAVVREHKMVEAQYMVGRSYHACGMMKEAEEAYQAALQIDSNHAPTISNLGELYWEAGKKDGAKKYWEAAVKADPKIVAARANLAMLDIEELRQTPPGDAWNKIEKDARDNLSSVLAVDNDHLRAYVLYGMLYMEGHERNKNRLDLAKLLLDEGAKRNPNFAPLEHAYGLYYLYKNNLTEALKHFDKAVELDPNLAEAHMNAGVITLGSRKYDVAKDHFQKVLDLKSGKDYDALIGLGVAERGLNDLDGAEQTYNKAKDLDDKRGEAYFNLGVLYKDFRAAKQSDLHAAQDDYRKAREFFKTFLGKSGNEADKTEAKNNIGDCDKVIKQLDDFIKQQASMPPQPPADNSQPSGGDKGGAAPSGGDKGATPTPSGDDKKAGGKGGGSGDKGAPKDAGKGKGK